MDRQTPRDWPRLRLPPAQRASVREPLIFGVRQWSWHIDGSTFCDGAVEALGKANPRRRARHGQRLRPQFFRSHLRRIFDDQGITIYQEKYAFNGSSKAKHMRAFVQVENAFT